MLLLARPAPYNHEFEKFRIRLLIRRTSVAQAASIVNAGIYLYLSWNEVNPVWLVAWIAWFTILYLTRIYFIARFNRLYIKPDRDFNPITTENWFMLGVFLSGLSWGFAALFLVPNSITYHALMAFILAGMSAGAAVAYSASLKTVQAYIIPALVPFAIRLFVEGTPLHLGMFFMIFWYLFSFGSLTLGMHKVTLESINLRFDKDQLLSDIQSAQSKIMQTAKMAALGEMAGGIAHEINTPLTVINLNSERIAELAEKNQLDQRAVAPIVEKINSMVGRVTKIITGLRAFAREGENDPFQKTSMKQLLLETLEICQARFRQKGIKLEIHNKAENLQLECRSVQIGQVLLNLLNNAFDAALDSPEKWVRIEISETSTDCIVRVIDSGPGVPPEIRDKITQPFFSTKCAGKGTGLGLSISFSIVKDHHGTLTLDTKSKSTCFLLSLPKNQTLELQMNQRKTVMVVDDDKDLREALTTSLGAEGYEVIEATGATQALESIRNRPVDVVISDVRMPGMDGIKLLQSIRNELKCPFFILMSGYSDVTSAKAKELGASAFFTKPFDVQEIRRAVAGSLAH